MRILFADALPERFIAQLTDAGHDCEVDGSIGADDLPDRIAGFDVLVVRSTKVTSEALDASDRLGLIVRAGAGTNTIDCQGAADRGIFVCNVPGTNSIAVAELTMGLLIAIDRHIGDGVADLRSGVWNKKRYQSADGLHGKTIGLIGLGEIALAVAERARGFGMQPIAVRKPGRRADVEQCIRATGIRLVEDQDQLLADSDIVSVHVPANAETVNLIDADFLAKMTPGSILLNTSRGDVVDEEALLAAMDEHDIRAGLDVFRDEPGSGTGDFTSALAQHPNVVGSHHIGASTTQAQDATAAGVIAVIESYAQGAPLNCVNMIAERHGQSSITIRHFDRVGVLASVLAILREHDLNVNTMENRIFAGSNAAVATIDVGGEVSEAAINEIGGAPNVINVSVLQNGR